nr:nucleoside-diphosphate kinase [uncultured Treponema sp.]
MTERTFVMMKPGVVQRRIAGAVLDRFEKKGLRLIGLKLMRISPELAKKHYAEHAEKPFFTELVGYITSGTVIAMAFEGDEAVAIVRKLCGATKVVNAEPGTIRGDYALHTNINIVHSSDSPESAARELGLFFTPEEFFPWEDGNAAWF